MTAASAARAWESLFRTQVHLMRRFEESKDFSPLTSREYDVLFTLAKAGEPMQLRELNEHVLLSQPSLSRMVDRLAAAELVCKRIDDGDRRSQRVSLTEEGGKLQRQIGRRHVRSIHAAFDGVLTTQEQRQLEELTSKLRAQARSGGSAAGTRRDGLKRPESAA